MVSFVKTLVQTQPTLQDIEVIYDSLISGDCSSRRRPDIRLDFLSHNVIVEVDESQHSSEAYCSCENKRVMRSTRIWE